MAQITKPKSITLKKATSPKAFRLGFEDKHAGLGFRDEYETWDVNDQLAYERGRIAAMRLPKGTPVRVKRQTWRGTNGYVLNPTVMGALRDVLLQGDMTG